MKTFQAFALSVTLLVTRKSFVVFLLFEKAEREIVKPYGAWMIAPLKRQVKPIGENGFVMLQLVAVQRTEQDRRW